MRFLGALLALSAASAVHAGPGLSQQETDAFGVQVARCWNVGSLKDASTVVTLRFQLDPQAKPRKDSFALIGAGKDTSDAVKSAYVAAKRAVLRCGAKGYELPLEKYDQWRNIELTFNPERMSLR